MPEEILTPRLRLEPIGPQHDDMLIELYTDPQVTAGLGREPLAYEQAEYMIDFIMGPWADDGFQHFAVYERAQGARLGVAGLRPSAEAGSGEIGMMLFPVFWNKGFGTEITETLLAWGFDELGLQGVVASSVVNLASLRMLEKCGFTEAFSVEEPGRTVFNLSLSREDFLERG